MILQLDHEGGVKATIEDNSVGGIGANRPKSLLLFLDCMMQTHDLPFTSRAQDIPIPARVFPWCLACRMQHSQPRADIWLACSKGPSGSAVSASSSKMASTRRIVSKSDYHMRSMPGNLHPHYEAVFSAARLNTSSI